MLRQSTKRQLNTVLIDAGSRRTVSFDAPHRSKEILTPWRKVISGKRTVIVSMVIAVLQFLLTTPFEVMESPFNGHFSRQAECLPTLVLQAHLN